MSLKPSVVNLLLQDKIVESLILYVLGWTQAHHDHEQDNWMEEDRWMDKVPKVIKILP